MAVAPGLETPLNPSYCIYYRRGTPKGSSRISEYIASGNFLGVADQVRFSAFLGWFRGRGLMNT